MQVLQELYVALTRTIDHPLQPEEGRIVVRSLFSWNPLRPDRETLEGAWELQDRYSLSWWDALVVSAARVSGSTLLLTEDLSHDQELEGVRVVDPMRVEPGSLRI